MEELLRHHRVTILLLRVTLPRYASDSNSMRAFTVPALPQSANLFALMHLAHGLPATSAATTAAIQR